MITVKTLVEATAWARNIDIAFQWVTEKLEGTAESWWSDHRRHFHRNVEASHNVAAKRCTIFENFSELLVGDGLEAKQGHEVAIRKLEYAQNLIDDEWHAELIEISRMFLSLKHEIEIFATSLDHPSDIEPDIELICDWLSQSANVWAHVRNDILLFQEHSKFATGAVTTLRLKKELQLIREIHSPLGAGLRGYALRMGINGSSSSRATLSEYGKPLRHMSDERKKM